MRRHLGSAELAGESRPRYGKRLDAKLLHKRPAGHVTQREIVERVLASGERALVWGKYGGQNRSRSDCAAAPQRRIIGE
jgi:hypothetical protein